MGRRLIVVLALALAVGIAFSPAFAEVQNVKVSGDLNMFGAIRNNFDLTRGPKGNTRNDDESFFATQTRVRVDADLTDNVSAVVRLINERKWGESSNTDIDLDLAYVGLKEFLYSPLSLTIGRQELVYGNKLILGKSGATDSSDYGVPTDLTLRKSFDAIKAVLNYDPLVVDLIYAKISENSSRGVKDDANLYGIYASYDVNRKLKADLYGFFRKDRNKGYPSTNTRKDDTLYTLGTLISATPIENLKTSLEAAIQLGRNRTDNVGSNADTNRKAWALQAMADYTLSDVKFTPTVGASFTHLSGDKAGQYGKRAWDPMYKDQALNNIVGAIIPFTNLNALNLKGSMKPTDDITLCANFGFYMRDKKSEANMESPEASSIRDPYSPEQSAGVYYYKMTGKKYLGNALDITATYDYTEDVQFGLTAGYFIPGNAFDESNRRSASQVIGSMKVTF